MNWSKLSPWETGDVDLTKLMLQHKRIDLDDTLATNFFRELCSLKILSCLYFDAIHVGRLYSRLVDVEIRRAYADIINKIELTKQRISNRGIKHGTRRVNFRRCRVSRKTLR